MSIRVREVSPVRARGGVKVGFALLLVGCLPGGCFSHAEPPGAGAESEQPVRVVLGRTTGNATKGPSATEGRRAQQEATLGTADDSLPFAPTGLKIASIAWRTWVYSEMGAGRERFGYLRAGAVLDARGPALKNEDCEGGWYRINPRGFVCLGLGATLNLEHPVVLAARVRPIRGQSLPYRYARAENPAPKPYPRFPSPEEEAAIERENVKARAERWLARLETQAQLALLGPVEEPPDYLLNQRSIAHPYGIAPPVLEEKSKSPFDPGNGFAFLQYFRFQDRIWGLSTELDLIALDRTQLVKSSEFHGLVLNAGENLPVAVSLGGAFRYTRGDGATFVKGEPLPRRQFVRLTGRSEGRNFHETADGTWLAGPLVRVITPPETWPPFATADRKWIDVSIENQALVAYEGTRPVYVTLVSTGKDGLKDPERFRSTVRGSFMIYEKDVSATMDSDENGDAFSLRDVPFVQYFHRSYALHGVYWHDGFGTARSHGCVNLAPLDAAWLFEWTDLPVPPDWHGVVIKERGTVVHVRP